MKCSQTPNVFSPESTSKFPMMFCINIGVLAARFVAFYWIEGAQKVVPSCTDERGEAFAFDLAARSLTRAMFY